MSGSLIVHISAVEYDKSLLPPDDNGFRCVHCLSILKEYTWSITVYVVIFFCYACVCIYRETKQ